MDTSGNLYIADRTNRRIRKVTLATGNISTVAGTGTNSFSGEGGPATSAALSNPEGVSVDASGNLYIADTGNQRIRKVVPGADNVVTGAADELISTIAGTGRLRFFSS